MLSVVQQEIAPDLAFSEHTLGVIDRMNSEGPELAAQRVHHLRDADTGVALLIAAPSIDASIGESIERDPNAVVRLASFGNGPSPWNKIHTQFLADATGQLSVMVEAPSRHGTSYDLTDREWEIVASGNFMPLAIRHTAALSNKIPGVESLGILGWSQGGVLALPTAKHASTVFEVSGVASGDVTTLMQRNVRQLLSALGKASYSDILKEIEDSGLSILGEAFRLSGDDVAGDVWRMRLYALDMLAHPVQNFRIAQGLGQATLANEVIEVIEEGIPVAMFRARNSAVCPELDFKHVMDDIEHRLGNAPEDVDSFAKIQPVVVEGNHAAIDNVKTLLYMAKAASARV